MASGYLNTSTGDLFHQHGTARRYDTGDVVYREGNTYFIVSRNDNQVKARGFRIDLDEITRHISAVDGIRDIYVAVLNNERTDHIVAFVMVNKPDMAEIIYQHLANQLPEYALPNHICQTEKRPTNPKWKNRRACAS